MSPEEPSQSNPAAEITVFEQDLSDLPLGPISPAHGAFGEYHTHPTAPGIGGWGDAVMSTGQKGPAWSIVLDGDAAAFEAGQVKQRRPAILVLDSLRSLRDYTVTAAVRPLSSKGRCGVVFGYRNNRTYYALLWDPADRLLLVREQHGARQVLARCAFPFGVDAFGRVRLTVEAGQITVYIDGREVMGAIQTPFETGQLDVESSGGKVGLIAWGPARFRPVQITQTPEAAHLRSRRLSERERELERLREANPKPELIAECPLGDFGAGRSLRMADLDDDGEIEFVIGQHSNRIDRGNYVQISCLTAFRGSGEVLWQIGRPRRPESLADAPTFDLPLQIADIDNDGVPELVMCRDWQIQIRDARSGELLRSVPTPRSTPGLTTIGWLSEDVFDRVGGDSIHLCDLAGRGYPGDFLLKDRYANLWAIDAETLEIRWHVALNTGHYPLAFDINGDGRDEVLCGFSLISAEGEVLWQKRFGDHVDGIAVGHFDGEREDYQVALVAGEAGFLLLSEAGDLLAHHDTGHAQKMSVGNFVAERDGVEIATITFWGSQGIFSVYDGAGGKLHESEPWHAASALTPVGWRGDGADLLLLSAHPTRGGMLDGLGRRVVMFPKGLPHLACDAIDLDGDGREEILAWDFDRFVILKAAGDPLGEIPRRHTGSLHNRSNYKANIAVPPEVIGR